jgi:hypothetical protein
MREKRRLLGPGENRLHRYDPAMIRKTAEYMNMSEKKNRACPTVKT